MIAIPTKDKAWNAALRAIPGDGRLGWVARVLPFWVGFFFWRVWWVGGIEWFGLLKRCERLEDWYLVDSKFVIGDKK